MNMTNTAATARPAAPKEGRDLLAISDAARALRSDWLYQLCGPDGRAQLLREHVPELVRAPADSVH